MLANDLFQWWNLIFLLPLFFSILWMLSIIMSGLHIGQDIDHDIGHDIGHDVHASGGASGHTGDSGDAHSGSDGHDHGDHVDGTVNNHSLMENIAWILGINEVPITMLLGVFSLSWGVIGLLCNQIFSSKQYHASNPMQYPAVYVWTSIIIAFAVSFAITRTMAALIAKYMPTYETYAVSRYELSGSMGNVIHTVSKNTGTVDVKDKFGNIHRVQAKTDDENSQIPPLSAVMVIDYDESDNRFLVRKI